MRYFLILSFFLFQNVNAQIFFDQSNSIQVSKNGVYLPLAWTGGLNAPQFSEVDINQDGYIDIVAFDRDAEFYIPFVLNPFVPPSQYAYEYIPKFNDILVKAEHWSLFRDINMDGKKDLLVSSNPGILYYKNTSTPHNPSFTFVEELQTKRGAGYIKTHIVNTDIPLIEDIDFDGDIDIATFSQLGSHIELNENTSTTTGEYDFELTDRCWGNFAESALTNDVTLSDSSCLGLSSHDKLAEPLHSGSTIAGYDLDNDGDFEVFIGDVSFNNIVQLTNSPLNGEDHMTSKIVNYPTINPINIQVFPAVYFVDFDKDGIKDMLVSPNSGNASESQNSVWFYKNNGSNALPNFVFNKTNAFQDQMIDLGRYSKIRLFDYNNDNLMDIVVSGGQTLTSSGIESTVSLYENTGTVNNPKFSLATDNFANLASLNLGVHLCPSFGDLDNDGKQDMIIGKNNGTLNYFKNESNSGNPWNFTPSSGLVAGIDVGYNATPTLFDINQDGKIDLLIGSREGKITYYENTGSITNPNFTFVTDQLGNIQIFSPFAQGFLDINIIKEGGNVIIYAGSSILGINRIENITGNLTGTFTITDSNVHNLDYIKHSSPALYDFNNDGYQDMLVGNIRGGVEYFRGIDELNISTPEYTEEQTRIYPNPSTNSITIESKINWEKYTIYSVQGQIVKQRQTIPSNIDISMLDKGQYFIKVSNSSNQETLSFIKN